jgi:L-histidine N-alpha-methyltransferase
MTNNFAEDVIKGLSSRPKYIPSKYFYDKRGSELFQMIMSMPEYYLTDCEFEILNTYQHNFLNIFLEGTDHFNLIEFGAGDGLKTKILLGNFLSENTDFRYLPIDISEHALRDLVADLETNFPELKVEGLPMDYFHALHELKEKDFNTRNVVLFLGSNIGNFLGSEARKFLMAVREELKEGDLLVTGFDLKKDPNLILDAYNDKQGITREFNMNLLNRINSELNADFELEHFDHYPTYDPITGETKSFIMSRRDQVVRLVEFDKSFSFKAAEPIYVEISQKYDYEMIRNFAADSGFEIVTQFTDSRNWFVDSVWKAV